LTSPSRLGEGEINREQQRGDDMNTANIIAIWERHLGSELFARDVDATMATMTDDPYVNHVPTMTGGVGAKELRRFYARHFITVNPDDMEVVPISRTVGEGSLSKRWSFASHTRAGLTTSSQELHQRTASSRFRQS
jgi:hypothetical protein